MYWGMNYFGWSYLCWGLGWGVCGGYYCKTGFDGKVLVMFVFIFCDIDGD